MSSALVIGSLLGCGAPSAASADRYAIQSGGQSAPYYDEAAIATFDVDLVDAYGAVLPTFHHRGKFYVMGDMGGRYAIRVRNPLGQRVEALISVDGLDVIDGEAGDLRKRGYIIEPYSDVTVDGFRTSMSDVAAFRFASVGASYAGRKGKARNVGVIAVAIFAERQAPRPRPPVYVPQPDYYSEEGYGGRHGKLKDDRSSRDEVTARPSAPSSTGAAGSGVAKSEAEADGAYDAPYDRQPEPKKRSGLGTEFGEQRYSSVTYGQFHRNSTRPFLTTEIRYNDRQGLISAGVLPRPRPYPSETYLRETANPFPGDHAFARPPR
ncbi:MAG: hypothetical protein IPL79_14320 [Myxococcales bacterium]|nr:hypothetical protein [Myxococcales bacterium]